MPEVVVLVGLQASGADHPRCRTYGARVVAYWFPPDLGASAARNATRAGRSRVPDVGLYATIKILREPSPADGFDEVRTVGFDGSGGFDVR